MTKADLIDSVAKRHELPRPKAEEIVNGFFDDIVAALKNGDKVNVSGFGTFSVSQRKGRMGRNPKTGEIGLLPTLRAGVFGQGAVSSAGEHRPCKPGVTGSNPVPPTTEQIY